MTFNQRMLTLEITNLPNKLSFLHKELPDFVRYAMEPFDLGEVDVIWFADKGNRAHVKFGNEDPYFIKQIWQLYQAKFVDKNRRPIFYEHPVDFKLSSTSKRSKLSNTPKWCAQRILGRDNARKHLTAAAAPNKSHSASYSRATRKPSYRPKPCTVWGL